MKVFVISLKYSQDRRENISKVLLEDGISFNFFDAEEIKDNPDHQVFKIYDKNKTKRLKGYELTLPEIGCFASHISLWQKCVAMDEPLLILEDNIEIVRSLREQLENIESITKEYGIVKLANVFERDFKEIKRIDERFSLVSHLRGACGTSAYAIAPKTAQKYLNIVDGFFEPVDDFMDNEWFTQQTLYSYFPCPVRRSKTKSTIGTRKIKTGMSIIDKISTEFYRAYKRIRQNIYNNSK